VNLQLATDLLRRTPAVLEAQLSGLPQAVLDQSFGEGWMSPRATVAHFIEGERQDWIPRTLMILEHGTGKTFMPFEPHSMYSWLANQPIEDLIGEFEQLRTANLQKLEQLHLKPADFDKRGRHPAFGEVTLAQLLSTWVAHDHYHMAQIYKSLAHQNEASIGPWKEYLAFIYESA
jgi:uncharacterized damage-inducible protein DinB